MCKTPIAYLLHILEECNYILSVVTDDLPMYQFLSLSPLLFEVAILE